MYRYAWTLLLALSAGPALAQLDCGKLRASFDKENSAGREHYAMAYCAAEDKDVEAAFFYLAQAAERGMHEDTGLATDNNFTVLHADPRWKPALARLDKVRLSFHASINHELRAIYEADQADRHAGPEIDWNVVGPRDAARMKRVREIVKAGGLKISADFLHAAFVFQHGNKPEHFRQAQQWSLRAAELDPYNKSAKWLACAAEDRWLQSIGKAQIWGTQFGADGIAQPFDRSARTDAQRRAMGVATMAEMEAMMAGMKAGKTTFP